MLVLHSSTGSFYDRDQSSIMPAVIQQDYALMPASSLSLHHESLMGDEAEAEPLSAYARWKLEEDERFYATFPEARYSAEQYNTISSAYLEGTGYYYDANGQIARSEETIYNEPSSPYATTYDYNASSPGPSQGHQIYHYENNYRGSDLARALDLPSQDDATRSSIPPTSHYDVTALPPPSVENVKPSTIVPALSILFSPEPIMDSLHSPGSSKASSSSVNPQTVIPKADPPSASYFDPSFLYVHPPSRSYNFYPSSTPQLGWPATSSTPPRSIRLSPLPPSRRPIAKKPPLACLFCRGRKIACGPPDPGSSDRSCNQCQRRSIKCEYPAESKRGLRKKKAIVHLNAAGPKVRVGRRSRVLQ